MGLWVGGWGCRGEREQLPAGYGVPFCDSAMARVAAFTGERVQGRGGGSEGGAPPTTVVVGTVAEVGGMNVFGAGDVGAVQHQMFVNLMTLVRYDENLRPVPYLARRWETREIGEGRMELRFFLRDDVRWHDGTPTTAYDVAFTFLRATDPRTGFPNASFFQFYLPGEEGVSVEDSLTVSFRFRPHGDYLDPWRATAIMPRHLLEGVPPEALARHPYGTVCPVGNGPFRFVSHSPNDRWVFEANPFFPEELGGRPPIDRYLYRVIPDQAALLAEFLRGTVDVYVAMPWGQAEQVRGRPDRRVVVFPHRSVLFVAWNTRLPTLADRRVRRAFTLAVNRPLLLQGVQGGEGVVLNSGVPPSHWAFDPSLGDSLPYDPPQARALLESAGWVDRNGDGVRENQAGEPLAVELTYHRNQERQEVAEILQAQLREVGVELRLRIMEFAAYLQAITSPERDFQAALVAFETEFRLDERDLFHSSAAREPFGFSGISDPVLDRYLDTLPLVEDRQEGRRLWREYQLRIIELQPVTYLYSAFRRDGVTSRLENVVLDTRGEWVNIGQWRVVPQRRRSP